MTFSSFAGGQVYNLNNLINDVKALTPAPMSKTPMNFPTKSVFSFTLREAYSKIWTHIPLEFSFKPSDVRMAVDSFDPLSSWEAVEADFPPIKRDREETEKLPSAKRQKRI